MKGDKLLIGGQTSHGKAMKGDKLLMKGGQTMKGDKL